MTLYSLLYSLCTNTHTHTDRHKHSRVSKGGNRVWRQSHKAECFLQFSMLIHLPFSLSYLLWRGNWPEISCAKQIIQKKNMKVIREARCDAGLYKMRARCASYRWMLLLCSVAAVQAIVAAMMVPAAEHNRSPIPNAPLKPWPAIFGDGVFTAKYTNFRKP